MTYTTNSGPFWVGSLVFLILGVLACFFSNVLAKAGRNSHLGYDATQSRAAPGRASQRHHPIAVAEQHAGGAGELKAAVDRPLRTARDGSAGMPPSNTDRSLSLSLSLCRHLPSDLCVALLPRIIVAAASHMS